MDELSASSTNKLIFVPSKDSYSDSFMSSVTDKPCTVRNTWNRKYRIKGRCIYAPKAPSAVCFCSSNGISHP